MPTRGAPLHRLLPVALLVLLGAGCARVFGARDMAPSGLATQEDQLRHLLAHGNAGTALSGFSSGVASPQDEVLRALYHGLVAYHAGDYTESARLFDAAGVLADDRVTKSLSRSAFALISNDLALPYEPAPTERLMIPYYAALARLRLGDITGATVETRRLSLLLQHFDEDARVDAQLRATLRYFAATVFALAGEQNDADVAYRNAVALGLTLPPPQARAAGDSGAVVIVLEQGFVAHRVEQGLMVMLLPEEIDAITGGPGEVRVATVALVAARVLNHAGNVAHYAPGHRPRMLFVPPPEHTPRKRKRKKTVCTEQVVPADSASGTAAKRVRECREVEEEVDELPYLLKIAWPVFRSDYTALGNARLVALQDTLGFTAGADLSRAVTADFERERLLVIARTIARGTAKLALTKGAEHKLEEKSEFAGKVVGLLGNVGNVLLERADTRSWHLLPGAISLAYVPLPAGEHTLPLTLALGDITAPRTVSVQVKRGQVSIAAVRVW
jgi:uncharacterized protein